MNDTRYVSKHVKPNGRVYWYWQRRGFPLTRLSDDEDERIEQASVLNAQADERRARRKKVRPGQREKYREVNGRVVTRVPAPPNTFWTQIFNQCRGQARRRGIEFGLTIYDLHDIVERSRGLCELSGIPLQRVVERPESGDGRFRHPWAPSIDRIDSRAGYRPDNARLVCVAVNLALADWGEEVFLRMVMGVSNSGRVRLNESLTFPANAAFSIPK